MKKAEIKTQDTRLTMKDLATRFNVSLQWVKENHHLIPSFTLGKRLRRFRLTDIEQFEAKNLRNAG